MRCDLIQHRGTVWSVTRLSGHRPQSTRFRFHNTRSLDLPQKGTFLADITPYLSSCLLPRRARMQDKSPLAGMPQSAMRGHMELAADASHEPRVSGIGTSECSLPSRRSLFVFGRRPRLCWSLEKEYRLMNGAFEDKAQSSTWTQAAPTYIPAANSCSMQPAAGWWG